MASKFGLDFTILDAAALRELRRSHGLEANPFAVYPRTVISLQWLRSPRVQRLLDEVLTPEARYPGYFDLLVVDEAHHCAPPAPAGSRRTARDSKQTPAVLVRDTAQRVLGVVAGAAGDAGPAAFRAWSRAGPGHRRPGDGAPSEG